MYPPRKERDDIGREQVEILAAISPAMHFIFSVLIHIHGCLLLFAVFSDIKIVCKKIEFSVQCPQFQCGFRFFCVCNFEL